MLAKKDVVFSKKFNIIQNSLIQFHVELWISALFLSFSFMGKEL